jgi:transcriptional regulator with XRE-family HTH domain
MAAPKPPSLDSATSAASAAATAATSAISSAIPSGADIGQFIREQRQHAKLSLRRLAEDAGVSNPYLSQIERGLRKPSAEILQQLAKGLRISAEQLYVQAGLLEYRGTSQQLEAAIVSDVGITERQKRVLLDIYASFVAENAVAAGDAAAEPSSTSSTRSTRRPSKTGTSRKTTAKKSAKTTAKSSKTTAKKTSKPRKTTSSPKATTKRSSH